MCVSSIGFTFFSAFGSPFRLAVASAGSIYWNPATTAALQSSEMLFSAALIYGTTKLSSTIPANAVGPGVPAATLSDTDGSDSGLALLPTMALL